MLPEVGILRPTEVENEFISTPCRAILVFKSLGGGASVEVEILRVHIRSDFVLKENYINPGKWKPLVYNFRHYFGLGQELGSTFRAEV